ncbi:MAG: hypothetical protein ACT443_09680 [Gemmatimonadota bacterium]
MRLKTALLLILAAAPAAAQDAFIPVHYDEPTGKLLLEITRLDQDLLYLNSLATGLGSNALGLDRGTIGEEAVVRFERHKYKPRAFEDLPRDVDPMDGRYSLVHQVPLAHRLQHFRRPAAIANASASATADRAAPPRSTGVTQLPPGTPIGN